MVEWPNIVLLAGWDKCLCPDGILRGTLTIQFASGFCLCGIAVSQDGQGKLGLKVSLKQPLSAGYAAGPSPRGSSGLGAR